MRPPPPLWQSGGPRPEKVAPGSVELVVKADGNKTAVI
jgi:hypothetical protein